MVGVGEIGLDMVDGGLEGGNGGFDGGEGGFGVVEGGDLGEEVVVVGKDF